MSISYEEGEALLRITRDATLGSTFLERMTAIGEALAVVIPASSISVFAIDLGEPGRLVKTHGFFRNRDLDSLLSYAEHYRSCDPMGAGILEARGQVDLLSDFVGSRFGSDAYTGEYLPRLGLRYIMGVPCRLEGDIRLAIALQRDSGLGDFTPHERRLMRLVAPDIQRAARGMLVRERAERMRQGDSCGMILWSSTGHMRQADATAMALLGRCDLRLAELIATDANGLVRGRQPREGEAVQRQLTTNDGRLLAVRSVVLESRPDTDVVTLIALSPETPPDRLSQLADRYRLTPREVDVARLAAEGLGNRHIGFKLGIATPTVGTYLTSIYRKTGSTGRVDLVRLLAGP